MANGQFEAQEVSQRGVLSPGYVLFGMPAFVADNCQGTAEEPDPGGLSAAALEHAVRCVQEVVHGCFRRTNVRGHAGAGQRCEAREPEGPQLSASAVPGDAVPGSGVVDYPSGHDGALAVPVFDVAVAGGDGVAVADGGQQQGEAAVVDRFVVRQFVAHRSGQPAQAFRYGGYQAGGAVAGGSRDVGQGTRGGTGKDIEKKGFLIHEAQAWPFALIGVVPVVAIPDQRCVDAVAQVLQVALGLAFGYFEARDDICDADAAGLADLVVDVDDPFQIAHFVSVFFGDDCIVYHGMSRLWGVIFP